MAARFVSPLFKAAKTAAPRAPSAARALSAAAEAGEKPNPWLKVDVYPIVFMLTLGCSFCVYNIGRCTVAHGDVTWHKPTKAKGVANWYADKYPGTDSLAGPGPKKAEH
mmetsp:Transcript_135556/g.201581  ORF Transcript_135556/g.201581 Transcript_135556/m.201581 type:complete len:109 (-) Transcript_135556:161-487(-)